MSKIVELTKEQFTKLNQLAETMAGRDITMDDIALMNRASGGPMTKAQEYARFTKSYDQIRHGTSGSSVAEPFVTRMTRFVSASNPASGSTAELRTTRSSCLRASFARARSTS